MHILHLPNSYGATDVYYNQYQSLDRIGIKQTIYVALNSSNHSRIGNQLINFEVEGSTIIYSLPVKWYHKYFYKNKIKRIVADLCAKVNMSSISLIHASNLCVDGAVAYELSKRFGIPFITAVRNTDINSYYKRLIWEKKYFSSILKASSHIIFISPQYKKYFLDSIIDRVTRELICNKISVIPNGVNNFYLENRNISKRNLSQNIRLVFVGAFQKGKNIPVIVDAVDILRKKAYNVELIAIGRNLSNRRVESTYLKYLDNLSKRKQHISLLDSLNKEELIKYYQSNDIFVMPSKYETFGLVYVEALTQGLPIIYTKGQGFDGFYSNGEVGYSVNAMDSSDVADKIELIIQNYSSITDRIAKLHLEKNFNWNHIGEKYVALYKMILDRDK